MKRIHRIRVDGLDPSPKYEGKWVALLALDGEPTARKFFISAKQMSSIQKGLDKPILFACFDYERGEDKPRMIWASPDKAWLENAFITNPRPAVAPPPVIAKPQFKDFSAVETPKAPEWADQDLPF